MTQTARRHFRSLLAESGIYEALKCINTLAVHRFTALYGFDGPMLRNVCLIDKENPEIYGMDDLPVDQSYCLYVRNSNQTFITENSIIDTRVTGHPKQESIQSYCGMPLIAPNGSMLGTICHFDLKPINFTDDEVHLLETITPDLVTWLEKWQSSN
jgi:GAF domain-containing protein